MINEGADQDAPCRVNGSKISFFQGNFDFNSGSVIGAIAFIPHSRQLLLDKCPFDDVVAHFANAR